MKYDLLIYDSENLADAFGIERNLIRINGLLSTEVKTIADILTQYGVSICLLPYKEE